MALGIKDLDLGHSVWTTQSTKILRKAAGLFHIPLNYLPFPISASDLLLPF